MPRLNENSALLLKTAIDSGITDQTELANIMGNSAVETGSFSRMHEDHRYSSAARLVSQVNSAEKRFSINEIEEAVSSRDPQQIFTIMYENRKDLGNTEQGDGYRYHGRGFFMYTGRANYTEYAQKFGVDIAHNPDLAAEPVLAAKLAIAYWKDKVPVDRRMDARLAGEAINGADNGAPERAAQSRAWARTITPELVQEIQSGRITLEQLSRYSQPGQVDPTVRALQQSLNQLGITDADGRSLDVDGDRGGPLSNTSKAIAAFQQEFGLVDAQLSNAELLTATQAALSANPFRRFGQETQTVSPEMLSQAQALGNFAPDPAVAATTAPPMAPRLGGSGRTLGTGDDDERQQAIDGDRAPRNADPTNAPSDQTMLVIPNPVQTRGPRDPRDPDDPNHVMNESVREQVKTLYAEHGANPAEQQLDQLTAGVMRDAKRSGLDQVKLIEFSVDPRTQQPNLNGNLIAYSGDPDDLVRTRWSKTDTQQAQQTAPERAYQDMDQAVQQRTQQQAQFEQQQRDLNRNPDGPTMQR